MKIYACCLLAPPSAALSPSLPGNETRYRLLTSAATIRGGVRAPGDAHAPAEHCSTSLKTRYGNAYIYIYIITTVRHYVAASTSRRRAQRQCRHRGTRALLWAGSAALSSAARERLYDDENEESFFFDPASAVSAAAEAASFRCLPGPRSFKVMIRWSLEVPPSSSRPGSETVGPGALLCFSPSHLPVPFGHSASTQLLNLPINRDRATCRPVTSRMGGGESLWHFTGRKHGCA